jgi:hypothetical protein
LPSTSSAKLDGSECKVTPSFTIAIPSDKARLREPMTLRVGYELRVKIKHSSFGAPSYLVISGLFFVFFVFVVASF